jgi:hypothetical protein
MRELHITQRRSIGELQKKQLIFGRSYPAATKGLSLWAGENGGAASAGVGHMFHFEL